MLRSAKSLLPALLGALLVVAAPAAAGPAPPPDGGGGTGYHKVHQDKPWSDHDLYKVQSSFYLRVDPSLDADQNGTMLAAGTWLPITCQKYAHTSAGLQLWDVVAGGFVPDSVMKTFRDRRLVGSPTCTLPHPHRRYAIGAWHKANLYRVEVTQVSYRQPNRRHGTGIVKQAGTWIGIACQTRGESVGGSTLWDGLRGGGYLPDSAMKTYYAGRIPGAPACRHRTRTPKKKDYFALGDSYSSGLGADMVLAADGHHFTHDGSAYYADDRAGKNCDRSPEAYARYLAGRIRVPTSAPVADFLACQGDTTKEVMKYQVPRVTRNTGLVTLTVMGNDMGFSDVLDTCAKTGDCPGAIRAHFGRHNSILKKRIHRLDRVLAAIRKRAPHTAIVVGGYPKLFDPPNFDLTACKFITTSEQARLNKAGDALDNAIRAAARRHHAAFADPRPWFEGHGPCIDGGPKQWINAIDLNGTSPEPWSMHPNHAGHIIYAEVFAEAAPKVFR